MIKIMIPVISSKKYDSHLKRLKYLCATKKQLLATKNM